MDNRAASYLNKNLNFKVANVVYNFVNSSARFNLQPDKPKITAKTTSRV